jgi:hypothetical protein
MANVKIGDLNTIADPISTDVLPIVDVDLDVTNKISIEELLKNAADGTAASPAFAFNSDPDTGIYRTGVNGLGLGTAGTGRLFIDSAGNIGAGVAAPSERLDVAGNISLTGTVDGRDVAADGTKLDGIAAGAEVNVDTNLSYTAATRVLASSTGTDATLPEVVASGTSGLMTGADKSKLDGIAAGAQVNVATNLSYTASTRVLASSTGTNATLPEVVASGNSGLITGTDKAKLDGIAAGAEVNVDTNLSYTASTRVLASSTGTNVTLPEVVAAGNSGLMTGADKTKLDGLSPSSGTDLSYTASTRLLESSTGTDVTLPQLWSNDWFR